ncbi:hypothetical protein BB561_003259 [Smittium simulii]|uniref:Ubiquinol-cytochrome c chaperone domain-containing protein n=1 Tax=Smittium simulii TaxID=133385 RepID=A0A2T9YMB9_9FUNG|nr:hypothetical protein BB561_003259 [Smittium simulii]
MNFFQRLPYSSLRAVANIHSKNAPISLHSIKSYQITKLAIVSRNYNADHNPHSLKASSGKQTSAPKQVEEQTPIEHTKVTPKIELTANAQPKTFSTAATFLRRFFKRLAPQYQALEIGKNIFQACQRNPQEFVDFWHKKANMPETFQSWFSVSLLYVWLCSVRLRAESKELAPFVKQQLIDNFFNLAEQKIRAQGIKSGKIVNDTLKDLHSCYLGMFVSFDQGFVSSDALLAAAVWRNVLNNCESAQVLEYTVDYIRQQLHMLDSLSSEAFITGDFGFDPPNFN